MNDKHIGGMLGTITTATGAVVSWLPAINLAVQIVAGLVAIVVGVMTIRYYHKKAKFFEDM